MSWDHSDIEPAMVSTIGYRLIRAAGVVHQYFARTLAECELSPLQHATLAWVDAQGPIHQKALAAVVNVDPGDLVKHLDLLQERGLVARERDAADRRRQLVSITAGGADLLSRANTLLAEAEEQCFADITPRERMAIGDNLNRIYHRAGEQRPHLSTDSFDIVDGRSALRAAHETS